MEKYLDTLISVFKPSFFEGKFIHGRKPESIELGYAIGFNHQPELIQSIRNSNDLDHKKLLKAGLWMITPSAVCQGGRSADNVINHTQLIQFDIDHLNKSQIQQYFNFIRKIPYVLYCGLSASGNGLWGLIPIAYPGKHKEHFEAISKAFNDVGITIDQAPKAINSARYLAYDPNHYWNSSAKVFEKIIEEKPRVFTPLHTNSSKNNDSKSLVDWFNHNCTAQWMDEILLNFGFNFHSLKGNRYRYTRPNKSTQAGLSIDYHEDRKTLFCFSSEVPLLQYWKTEASGWSCSPVTALLLYGCGGMSKQHWRTAFQYINSKLL